ncbi:MAG: D-alanine--D-alanine ligase [Calditrichia bacterium]
MKEHIAVLMGGTSAERDVSLVTGSEIAKALRNLGYRVTALDTAFGDRIVPEDSEASVKIAPAELHRQSRELNRNIFKTVELLLKNKVDAAFIALHGGAGEDGRIQAVLDMAGIPYTGSDALASALGMDKHLSKTIFKQNQIPTAPWGYLSDPNRLKGDECERLGLPLVVKPNRQGSTVGLTIVEKAEELPEAVKTAFEYDTSVILESYIPGRELTVAVLDGQALPVVEIVPEHGIYDYECKYQGGKSQYFVPADLPDDVAGQLAAWAVRVFEALGCRHYARVDFRLTPDNSPFCLEINTLPGMTPTSLVPKAARAVNLSFEELIDKIIRMALNLQ